MRKMIIAMLLIGGIVMSSEAVVQNAELLAINMIAKFEGFRSEPYTCPGGHLTIGYGFADPEIVAKGRITRKEADRILGKLVRADLAFIQKKVPGLNVRQQAAVCSFIHNFGRQGFLSSTYCKKLKAKDIAGAKAELAKWVHVKKWDKKQQKYVTEVAPGLVKRRDYEARYL